MRFCAEPNPVRDALPLQKLAWMAEFHTFGLEVTNAWFVLKQWFLTGVCTPPQGSVNKIPGGGGA